MTKKKTTFVAQVAVLDKEKNYTAGGMGLFDPGDIAVYILPNLRGGQLFAYLFRRFGYPDWGWDDHKELTHYLITTPMPDVFLEVRPYMGGDYPANEAEKGYDHTKLMFGYCVTKEIQEVYYGFMKRGKHDRWETSRQYKQCNTAFEKAMRDLLRPVYVRDVPINCYGRVSDEVEQKLPPCVERSHMAGYPIPALLLRDIERWLQFWDALCTLGQGSADKGIDNVIKTAASFTFYEKVEQAEMPEKQELLRQALAPEPE